MDNVYHFQATMNDGTEKHLSDYEGKVLLIVNTASQCGFTPQYKELQEIYEKYNASGLEILSFPCNQFRNQEPGNNEEIQSFCQLNYGVTFPIFRKVHVKGPHAHPLYQYITFEAPGLFGSRRVKWNFTKFLVDRQGRVVRRFSPSIPPSKIEGNITKLLELSLEEK